MHKYLQNWSPYIYWGKDVIFHNNFLNAFCLSIYFIGIFQFAMFNNLSKKTKTFIYTCTFALTFLCIILSYIPLMYILYYSVSFYFIRFIIPNKFEAFAIYFFPIFFWNNTSTSQQKAYG
jgi:hypothetical protein